MLETLRIALYSLLVVIGLFLYQAWQREHPVMAAPPASAASGVAETPSHFTPDASARNESANTTAREANTEPAGVKAGLAAPATGQLISVKTDLMDVAIDTRGGDIVSVKLPAYPESLGSKQPFTLLTNDSSTRYIAESGLLGKMGPDTSNRQALYTMDHSDYSLDPGENDVVVTLRWQKNGIKVLKTFTFTRGSYEIKVGYTLNNQSSEPWAGNLYTQLMRKNTPPVSHGGFVNLATYFGAAITTPAKAFQKVPFKEMDKTNLEQAVKDGWVAMIQHYFVGAWVPPKEAVSTYYSKVTQDGLYTIGMIGQALTAQPGTQVSTQVKLYAGPAIADLLEQAAPGLKLTIDYGWFWFISALIFMAMQKIYAVVGNWGWSIVLVTVVIKLIFYPLSAKSYRSMSVLKKLQPKMAALKERFAEDKQKLTQATMELYRQEKVNPMSGCLPVLIQIPVFIALYWVLVESVQLRQAPFIFWIHDLSQQDPYYVLPVLMGLSMFVQQRLNPPPPDPIQAKVMMMMPLVFTVLFASFPAGLMLYWFVNNTLSFAQQWYVMRSLDK
ncbi:MAG: membrane protein insertase YidC [Gammaproteobacteria bacterium RIFCSPHIGHO2_12_FULL_45_12]|nr:MAG: membrane protein insertase YidC [Gammaproteobacteria bacterium RIFCSPHIGHO2_12_FULL_45_12]